MTSSKPYVLSIAGFDPSAGAGVLADVKTFEGSGVYGLGVLSAITYQNDRKFEAVEWVDAEKIIRQTAILLDRFDTRYIKSGLIENIQTLKQVTSFLKNSIDNPVIIFDPILKASAGFAFHENMQETFHEVMDDLYCITPNIPEARQLFGTDNLHDKLISLSTNTNIYLKGGHDHTLLATDTLYSNRQTFTFLQKRLPNGGKHGSGCVLSSSLAAQLALGYSIDQAAEKANTYTYHFLASNETLLGYHQPIRT